VARGHGAIHARQAKSITTTAGRRRQGLLDRFMAITGLADHTNSGPLEEPPEAAAHQTVIVHQQDRNGASDMDLGSPYGKSADSRLINANLWRRRIEWKIQPRRAAVVHQRRNI